MTAATRHEYTFALDQAPGDDVELLGGKGAGLVRMVAEGIPVPPGFVLTTACGREYLAAGQAPPGLQGEIEGQLRELGGRTGRPFGDAGRPLLVSVRSGAPVSMPGMMDTILNVGLTNEGVITLARETGDARFAWSCFERLLDGFARTVRGIDADVLEDELPPSLAEDSSTLQERCETLLALIARESGTPFPDPAGQLQESVGAVFRSWHSRRAKAYRRHKGIDEDMCTAVVIQAMVFGNRGDDSGSGVVFTRSPADGAPGATGEFLLRAQGEDVVSGEFDAGSLSILRERLPGAAAQLDTVLGGLERGARDMCDVEFTVENGELWILQTRVGQRSSRAALRIAVDMADEGLITRTEAVRRVEERGLDAVACPTFSREPEPGLLLARGIASSPGAAIGLAAFDSARAQDLSEAGQDVVLVRPTTAPADLPGLLASVAVVTGRGGPMSHAAVVARGLDRPAVCGVGAVVIAADRRSAVVAGQQISEGDELSVDGDRGLVARGRLDVRPGAEDARFQRLLEWRTTDQA